nr:MAG TPA: hypothetical protein [Caudoviricetes sp.]
MSKLPDLAFYKEASKQAHEQMASYVKMIPNPDKKVIEYFNSIISRADKAATLVGKDPQRAIDVYLGS